MRNLFLIIFPSLFFGAFLCAQNVSSVEPSDAKNTLNKTSYIENKGQWDNRTSFLTRSGGLDGWVLTDGSMLLDFYKIEKNKVDSKSKFNREPEDQFKDATKKGQRILIKWVNGNIALNFEKTEKQEGYYNYLVGHDASKHASNVELYGQIRGENLYNGVDLKYYHKDGSMRYDLIVHPNADPGQIKLKIDGADNLKIENGNVIISTSLGEVSMQDLYVYELETKKQISCKWIVSDNELTLSLGSYNKSNTLVIDPLIYSTFIGGSVEEYSNDIAVDNAGNAYITGATQSVNFDITPGAYQTSFAGIWDVFISKLNPAGTALVFSTYIGGSSAEHSRSIAADAVGNSYITGYTNSSDYDITIGAFQTISGGGGNGDVFVTKLNSAGTTLIYSTYVGGGGDDQGFGIALDALNNAYITGWTISSDYDVTPGAYQLTGDPTWYDAFITKLNPSGSSLLYSTFIGGSNEDKGIAIAVDALDNAYVTGYTFSTDFDITSGVYQPLYSFTGSGSEVFVTKLNPTGSNLSYSTFLGGSSFDRGYGIAVDTSGNAFVTGETESQDFDVTPGSFQIIEGDAGAYSDAFVTKLSSTASTLSYSTYLGGNSSDQGYDISIDQFGSAYITGGTYSTNFNTTIGSYQPINQGAWDVFVTKLHPNGSTLDYSSYIGGSSVEKAFGMAVDNLGGVFLTGQTQSSDYDITSGAYQVSLSTSSFYDAFVTKIDICPTLNITFLSSNVSCNGNADGSAAVFASGASGPYTYSWSNGQINDTAFSLSSGTYFVTVTNGSGCSAIDSIAITQPAAINASIVGSSSICSGQNTTLAAIGSGTYTWNTGATSTSINVSPLITTNYSVVVSNGSCSDTANATIIVIPVPVANITGADSICLGEGAILTATGGGTYSWSTGSTSNSVSVNPVSNLTYSVIVTNSGCSDTALLSVIVNPLPIANITGTTTICIGQNTILTAAGGGTYNWNTGAISSSITVTPPTNTTYSVIVKNAFGCADTAITTVTVIPLPTVAISGNTIICDGEVETLTASGIGNVLWNTGDTTSFITISPLTATSYSVTASNFCGSASDSITVNVNPLPIATISNDTTILLGNSSNINAAGGVSYSWLPLGGLSCTTCSNPIASPQSTTTYSVTITGVNGCSITKTITITIDDDFEIFVPDVFSPNGDGQNDILYVRGLGIKDLKFIIYDRLGEKIFESNDITKGWDGTYKGNALNNAVFVYYVSATMVNNQKINVKGDVTLIK